MLFLILRSTGRYCLSSTLLTHYYYFYLFIYLLTYLLTFCRLALMMVDTMYLEVKRSFQKYFLLVCWQQR